MVATMVIETALAVYTVWRYKMTATTRLIALALFMLAGFQMAEFFDCTGYIGHGEAWSQAGFVFITTLPPLGLHILHRLADKSDRHLVAASYLTMWGFIGFFLTSPDTFTGHQCAGNYVIFQLANQVGGAYAAYYYGWLLIALLLGAYWANQLVNDKAKSARRKLETIRGLLIGYLVFLLPTATVNILSPSTLSGIPSIMCGFAVLFALILALYILPRAAVAKRSAKA